jgi:hypothetical protein
VHPKFAVRAVRTLSLQPTIRLGQLG